MVKMRKFILSIVLFCSTIFYLTGQKNTLNSEIQNIYNERRAAIQQCFLNIRHESLLKSDQIKSQKLDSIIEYKFDDVTNAWDKKFRKEVFYYDNSFNEITFEYFAWDETNNYWYPLYKEDSNYDEYSNQIEYISYNYGEDYNWTPFYKDEYAYNDNNVLTETLGYRWRYSENTWRLLEKKLHSYYDNGLRLSDSIFYWSNDLQDWKLMEKVNYELYKNKLGEVYKFNWNENDKKWINSEHLFYSYLNIGLVVYCIDYYLWNKDKKEWIEKQIEAFGYDDTRENINRYEKWEHDIYTNETISSTYIDYTYDYNFSFNEIALPNYISTRLMGYQKNKIISHKEGYTLKPDRKKEQYRFVEYYYSQVKTSTDISNFKNQQVKVYPNPTHGSIHFDDIKVLEIKIYDIAGSLRFKKSRIQQDEVIDISVLEKGLYNAVIKTEQGFFNTKIIRK